MTSKLPSAENARTEETADGSLTLGWNTSHVTYRSRYGAWTEANHVFIEGADVFSTPKPAVFEFGLGAATNLFATLDAFVNHPTINFLTYETLENSPLPLTTFEELIASYPVSAEIKTKGLDAIRRAITGVESVIQELAAGKVLELKLHKRDGLPKLPQNCFTAIYFDPFGPQDNPDAWTASVFENIAHAMTPEARLATYAAASEPRRRMKSAGLHVARREGAGGKREMTIASKSLDSLQELTIWPKKLK